MPENVKLQTAKDLRATCKAYDTLAEIYKEGDRARLEAEARAGMKVWQGVSDHQSSVVVQAEVKTLTLSSS